MQLLYAPLRSLCFAFALIVVACVHCLAQTLELGWVQQLSGSGSIRPTHIAADPTGTTYITGVFDKDLTIGTNTYYNCAVLVSYTAAGDLRWVLPLTGDADCVARWVTISPDGGVVICGSFAGGLQINTQHLTGSSDWFVAKFTSAGDLAWVRQGGQSGFTTASSVVCDSQNNVFVASQQSQGQVLSKYTPAGDLLWSRVSRGDHVGACDSEGNVYRYGLGAAYKFTPDGDSSWVAALPATAAVLGLAATPSGSVFCGGYLDGTAGPQFFSFVSTNGSAGTAFGGEPSSAILGVQIGWKGQPWVFGHTKYYYISMWSESGHESRLMSFASYVPVEPLGLGLDSKNNVYVTGLFSSSGNFGNKILVSRGAADMFVARYTFVPPFPVQILQSPVGGLFRAGETITLDVSATGFTPPTYQWRKNGVDLPGQNASSLRLAQAQPSDSGDYDVVVQAGGQSVTSDAARLIVDALPTVVITEPADFSFLFTGQDFRVVVDAHDDGSVTNVQLFVDNLKVASKQTPPYEFTIHIDDEESHTLIAVASDDYGLTQRDATVIFVGRPPVILRQPMDVSAPLGANVQLSAFIDGTRPLIQQWFKDGQPIPASSPSTLFLTNITLASAGEYMLQSSNDFGVVRTIPAVVTVTTNPMTFVNVSINGIAIATTNVAVPFIDRAEVTLESGFTNGIIFLTTDGSTPDFNARMYTGPFTLTADAILRAVAYRDDFAVWGERGPITLTHAVGSYLLLTTNPPVGSVSRDISRPDNRYAPGELVRLTATASAGWTFLGWSGDSLETNSELTVQMDRSKAFQANFGTTLDLRVGGSGDLRANPSAALYPYGSRVQVTAVPESSSYFVLWGGDASGNTNPLSFSVTNAQPMISALFTRLPITNLSLVVVSTGEGTVLLTPPGNKFAIGQNVTIQAQPGSGQVFLGWSGDLTGTNNPAVVKVNSSRVITARFSTNQTMRVRYNSLPDSHSVILSVTSPPGALVQIDSADQLNAWTPFLQQNLLGNFEFTQPATNAAKFFILR